METSATLESAMRQRSDQYLRVARTICDLVLTSPAPVLALHELLMDAYRDGGRDMHKAITEILDERWETP